MADISGWQNTDREHHQEGAVVPDTPAVPAWVVGDRTAALSVSRAVYSRKAVLAAAYKLADRCAILVDADGENRWVAYVIANTGADPKSLLGLLIRELGDQALREQLESEFGAVRTLIVAQAFSEGNLLNPARDEADDRLDPFGTEQRR
jgi:His-Xaa-Ser system protein HxsD